MGEVLALSQSTKCGYEEGDVQLGIRRGKKLPAFAAEVVCLDVSAKLPNCKGREALNEKNGVSESLETRF